ncbi:MAG: DNA-3-methyladenine glycosylase, partial [Sciscionella sp.]
ELARGPARLTSALGIGREDNGADIVAPSSPLRLLAGDPVGEEDIETGPRVGVAAAMNVPWRFWLRGAASVSPYRRGGKRRARS